jgi:MFS family permease
MKDLSSTYRLERGGSEATVDARSSAARQRFLLALLLSTWIPMLFFISLAHLDAAYFSIRSMKSLFLFLGTAHVPATFFFYTDRNFSHIVRGHKARYIYFPLALTIGAGLLVAFSNTQTQAYLFLVFWAWQAFHYGRQNLGIYSFTAIAQSAGAPDKLEKLAIDLATVCGILGTFRVLGMGVAPEYLRPLLDQLYRLGMFGYSGVIVFSLYVYAKNFERTTLLKSIFFWTLVLFFLPIYLSNDINVTFLSYAIAHGLQYIIFMGIVSFNSEEGEHARAARIRSALILMALMVMLGLIFYHAGTFKSFEFVKSNGLLVWSFDFLFGAVLGATMAHFVIDAGAWRLSKQPQREYMTKRFGFILAQKESGRELGGAGMKLKG